MEEERARRRKRILRRIHRYRRLTRLFPEKRLKDRENPYEYYNSVQFKTRFHMYKETAMFITDLIKTDICFHVKRGSQIPPHLQFLIAQRFFATGSFQIVLGDLGLVNQSTVSLIIKRVAIAIAKKRNTFLQFPRIQDIELFKQEFYNIGQFPGEII
jgi:hypothetical protein